MVSNSKDSKGSKGSKNSKNSKNSKTSPNKLFLKVRSVGRRRVLKVVLLTVLYFFYFFQFYALQSINLLRAFDKRLINAKFEDELYKFRYVPTGMVSLNCPYAGFSNSSVFLRCPKRLCSTHNLHHKINRKGILRERLLFNYTGLNIPELDVLMENCPVFVDFQPCREHAICKDYIGEKEMDQESTILNDKVLDLVQSGKVKVMGTSLWKNF